MFDSFFAVGFDPDSAHVESDVDTGVELVAFSGEVGGTYLL